MLGLFNINIYPTILSTFLRRKVLSHSERATTLVGTKRKTVLRMLVHHLLAVNHLSVVLYHLAPGEHLGVSIFLSFTLPPTYQVGSIKDYISGRSEFMREILDRGQDGLVKEFGKWEKMTPDERVEHLKELGGMHYWSCAF